MAKKCHICNQKIKGEQPECPNCRANVLSPSEVVIRSDFVTYRNGKANVAGHAILTNYRMLFKKDDSNSSAAMFGLIGAAVAAATSKHPILFEIPQGGIQRIETGVTGILKNPTITFFTSDGECMLVVSKKQFGEMKVAYGFQ